jgi:hypothetical protein
MKPILITLTIIIFTAIGVLTNYWPPAGFAFVVIGTLAILGVRSLMTGGVSVRAIFVTHGGDSTGDPAILRRIGQRRPSLSSRRPLGGLPALQGSATFDRFRLVRK